MTAKAAYRTSGQLCLPKCGFKYSQDGAQEQPAVEVQDGRNSFFMVAQGGFVHLSENSLK